MLVILREGRRAGEKVDMPMPLALRMLALGRVGRVNHEVPAARPAPAVQAPVPATAKLPSKKR
jgi:hypothetical protein